MKLKLRTLENIYSSEYIFSMSMSRKDLASRLEETTIPLIEHLIKLYIYPNLSEYVSHWRQEVYEFLHSVSRIKGKNTFPSAKFILKNTLDINIDMIQILYEDVVDDYSSEHGTPSSISITTLISRIKEYYEWLSTTLSDRGRVSRSAVYQKLEELGFGNEA